MSAPLAAIVGLRAQIGARVLLDGVSLHVAPGETVALVGESGSGKSLTALALIGMLPRAIAARAERIELCGIDVAAASPAQLRRLRGTGAALIFQDPMTALMPLRPVGRQLADMLAAHLGLGGAEAKARGLALFAAMGLADPEWVWRARPYELSGGQRQRALIALALAAEPRLVIADEVTTALDADARQSVLDLIARHVRGNGRGALIICHDLGLVKRACDRVYVMRAGRIVEEGRAAEVLAAPRHPYTRMLLAALPERSPPKTPLPVEDAA